LVSEVDKRPSVFSSATLAPIGLLVISGGSVLSVALWLNTKLSNLEHGQTSLAEHQVQAEHRLDRIEVKLDSQFVTEDKLSGWIDLLQADNKDLTVPPFKKQQ